jgi:phosphate transport system permease protein
MPSRPKRERSTPKSVARAERTARWLIYAAGFGTIAAIVLIFGFLVSVVIPLFADSEAGADRVVAEPADGEQPIGVGCDEYRAIAWEMLADGTVRLFSYHDGAELDAAPLFPGAPPTAHAMTPDGSRWLLGFKDGTVRFIDVKFEVRYIEPKDLPESFRSLPVAGRKRLENGIVERTPENQYRFVAFTPKVGDPVAVTKSPIRAVDLSFPPSGTSFAVLSEGGELVVATVERRLDMMSGEEREVARKLDLPISKAGNRGLGDRVALSGGGNELYVVWNDGFCIRYDARRVGDDGNPVPDNLRMPEKLNLIGKGGEVRALGFLNGKSTLLVGDNAGVVHAWFPTRPEIATTIDGMRLARARSYQGPRSAVRSLTASPRSRLLLVGYESGAARVYQGTRSAMLASVESTDRAPVGAIAFAPKEDALLVRTRGGTRAWEFDPGHHDVSLGTLFFPTWYERSAKPANTWQSTGSDDAEPKLGLVPLIFGTLKATLYSMLMAIPLALLAAIYTSEFLRPSVRASVKSVIEMMASLPSVVLGFLAALVIAPFVAKVLPGTLAALLTIPFAFVLGARLWQLLPTDKAVRWDGLPKFFALCLTLPLGLLLAAPLGPVLENVFFGGNVEGWLAGQHGVGGAAGGWTLLLIPFSLLLLALLWGMYGAPRVRSTGSRWSRARCAQFDLARFGGTVIVAVGLAALLGFALSSAGLDPRASFVGSYVPRNAMIVGFAMGFAIVPIIYTLAEDALSGVPSQLREGSLGAGATPWQTAVRIILPTAASGIFGAIMVGLGRAVGETMIVLMAAGNTPIMEWNPFDGFRALSANIATELPEAPRGSSHYRVLFLSGLVLFAMTFVINTVAEFVRRRFRARYAEQL